VIAYGWTRSLRGAGACLAVFAVFAIADQPIAELGLDSVMYVLAYILFLVAAGLWWPGAGARAWIFALTGWFLIQGTLLPVILVWSEDA